MEDDCGAVCNILIMAILSTDSVTIKLGSYNNYKVFNDESVDETKSDAIDSRAAKAVTLIVEAGAGVSSGVVKLEGAPTSDYAGTWVEMASLTINVASKIFSATVDVGDANGLPMPYVRARIETVIGGGTIDAYIITQT